ncbi:MAG: HD-GYP domain-containing protein [Desulfosporosinus sp.]|nr:HD-GYP domain-containing protein [Desulfosporosinus sp.]
MRRANVQNLKTGDIIDRAIYTDLGHILLGRGIVLNDSYISKLKQMGITIVYIDDEQTSDIIINDIITENHRRDSTMVIKQASNSMRVKNDFDVVEIKTAVFNIVEDILGGKEIMLNLADMRSADNQIYSHAVSVCALATVLGKALGLKRGHLEAMAVGALLHEIGTTKLPKYLMNKRTPFTAEESAIYQTHSQIGYDILRGKKNLSILSAHVVLQHHEWLNGCGYPKQLSGNQIHLLAQIVGIVDFYDNLINDGPGHERVLHNEACELLMACAGDLFQKDLIITFLRHVAVYPIGSTVKLSTGELGVVIRQNNSLPLRPVVRVYRDGDGKIDFKAREYDLVKDLNILVVDMFE